MPNLSGKFSQLLSHISSSINLCLSSSCSIQSNNSSVSLLFSQIQPLLDLELCNSLIKSFTRSNQHLPSLIVFTQMPKLGILPDLFTLPPVIKSASQVWFPRLGISIHGCATKLGFESDVFTNTALVHMYCSFTCVSDARKLFDEMPERNSVSWNAMITGYVHNRLFKEAHELFFQMQTSGIEMGEVTMVTALSACAHLGALSLGVWIHNYVKENRLRMNVFVGTALIDMYMKCGAVDEAINAFHFMRMKNVFTWNALISGFAMNGRGEAAVEAYRAMEKENIKPDSVTFLGVLCACCHQGLIEEGKQFFFAMENKFMLSPKIEHYSCMVDLLGRAGSLDEAHELIQTMPIKPDAAVWRSLLAACRVHGHTRLGELAIRSLLELEPDNGDNYILLSNILVREGRWEEVGKVRQLMSRRGIHKVPGCSSIEINNAIHEFVVTSRSERTGLDDIFIKLEDMDRELKAAGYIVDTELVSYDVQEEEKESSLMYHSEKLALAFGLLRASPHSTIRIVKNLRVCKDCHSYLKLVSKVYNREIVVRDRNRFHHFLEGACSCRDYW